ncbi:MAG: GNAT family N-acetyltransferase [Euzebya sp.]
MDPRPDATTSVASSAAAAAGCVIALLEDMGTIALAADLFDQVWQARAVMPSNLIRAIQFGGGYVSGAFVEDEMRGASVAFLGTSHQADDPVMTLHSHITGVLGADRGIGYALKLHQRQWCQQHGVNTISWTFDPLIARNAYFNLAKLGAIGTAYLTDHYGEMADGINAGQGSDRLLARWDVGATRAPTRPALPADPPIVVLDRDTAGEPVATDVNGSPHEVLAIAAPADILRLRRRNPSLAHRWRRAVRDHLIPLMAAGYQATGMTRDGYYLLTRTATHGPAGAP